MASAISLVGFTILAMEVFNAVPDILPLTFALAIKPNANDVSSIEYFIAPATGATYLNDSPSIDTSVLAFALA